MNVLAIGAHFDDIELGCAGSLLRHIAKGDKVYSYVATVSGFSSRSNEKVRTWFIMIQCKVATTIYFCSLFIILNILKRISIL